MISIVIICGLSVMGQCIEPRGGVYDDTNMLWHWGEGDPVYIIYHET